MQFSVSARWRMFVSACMGAVLLVGVLSACGSGSSTTAAAPGKGCKHVALLLPESGTAARWEAADHPLTQKAITDALPGATVDALNAQGNATTQQTQAESELTQGACILVVAPFDATASAAIVTKAKAKNVPVIAYDRLIQSDDLAYYVSFDGVDVGKKQGQYIADHYKDYVSTGHKNVVMIKGAQTDNNAVLFGNGAHQILDPLFNAGTLTKVYEQFTEGWKNDVAQTEMDAALTQTHNDVQIAYVMNDGMANTVIASLGNHGLTHVLVTGQDAEVSGVRNILLGKQSMTVYKPIKTLATATGQLVAAISNGTDTSSIASAKIKNANNKDIPSVLNPVQEVDISNVKDTVIADGFVSKTDVCKGVPAGAGGVC